MILKLTFPGIEALTILITGNSPSDLNQPISPYRSFQKIETFFKTLRIDDEIIKSVNPNLSRPNYTEAILHEINGTDVMSKVVSLAFHPKHFANTNYSIETAVQYLNEKIEFDEFKVVSKGQGFEVVPTMQNTSSVNAAPIKQIIFASNGPKPDLVFDDALSNSVRVVKNEEYCLVYSNPILYDGLWQSDLVKWWQDEYQSSESKLHSRLIASLDSEPETIFYNTYKEAAVSIIGEDYPALLPQVYFHFDPLSLRQLGGQKRLPRQRMDFLILLPKNHRIVIEIDGKHHYADINQASPQKYAEMASEDRKLKLAGYDIYRFGGYEFTLKDVENMIKDFVNLLFQKYSIDQLSDARNQTNDISNEDDFLF